VAHGGVLWQGEISREMLLSIFWQGTPVHDGAAVMQGGRIAEVAAILPLLTSSALPSHFGTGHVTKGARHRTMEPGPAAMIRLVGITGI
jgi:DNA integrity scanning protein DisA with diadenylate cyclase activity